MDLARTYYLPKPATGTIAQGQQWPCNGHARLKVCHDEQDELCSELHMSRRRRIVPLEQFFKGLKMELVYYYYV